MLSLPTPIEAAGVAEMEGARAANIKGVEEFRRARAKENTRIYQRFSASDARRWDTIRTSALKEQEKEKRGR